MTAHLVNGKWVTRLPPGQLVTDTRNTPPKTEKRKGKNPPKPKPKEKLR